MHDSQVDPPAMSALRQTSISGERMSAFVQNLAAKRVLIILDTCYSAAAFSQIPGNAPADAQALGVSSETFGYQQTAFAKIGGSKDLFREDDLAQPVSAPTKAGPQ